MDTGAGIQPDMVNDQVVDPWGGDDVDVDPGTEYEQSRAYKGPLIAPVPDRLAQVDRFALTGVVGESIDSALTRIARTDDDVRLRAAATANAPRDGVLDMVEEAKSRLSAQATGFLSVSARRRAERAAAQAELERERAKQGESFKIAPEYMLWGGVTVGVLLVVGGAVYMMWPKAAAPLHYDVVQGG